MSSSSDWNLLVQEQTRHGARAAVSLKVIMTLSFPMARNGAQASPQPLSRVSDGRKPRPQRCHPEGRISGTNRRIQVQVTHGGSDKEKNCVPPEECRGPEQGKRIWKRRRDMQPWFRGSKCLRTHQGGN